MNEINSLQFEIFPTEILFKIFQYLDYQSFHRLRASSSFFSKYNVKESLSITEMESEIEHILNICNTYPVNEVIYFYYNNNLFDVLSLQDNDIEPSFIVDTSTRAIKENMALELKRNLKAFIEYQIDSLNLKCFLDVFKDDLINTVDEESWLHYFNLKLQEASNSFETIESLEEIRNSNKHTRYNLNTFNIDRKLNLCHLEIENQLDFSHEQEDDNQTKYQRIKQLLLYGRLRLIFTVLLLSLPLSICLLIAEPLANIVNSELSEPVQASLYSIPLIAVLACICSLSLAVSKYSVLTDSNKALEDLKKEKLPRCLYSNSFFNSIEESVENEYQEINENSFELV